MHFFRGAFSSLFLRFFWRTVRGFSQCLGGSFIPDDDRTAPSSEPGTQWLNNSLHTYAKANRRAWGDSLINVRLRSGRSLNLKFKRPT